MCSALLRYSLVIYLLGSFQAGNEGSPDVREASEFEEGGKPGSRDPNNRSTLDERLLDY